MTDDTASKIVRDRKCADCGAWMSWETRRDPPRIVRKEEVGLFIDSKTYASLPPILGMVHKPWSTTWTCDCGRVENDHGVVRRARELIAKGQP